MAHFCERLIRSDYNSHACGNNAKYEYKGRHYCGIHHPPMVKERARKTNARFAERDRLAKLDREERVFNKVAKQHDLTPEELIKAIEEFQKKKRGK